MDSRNEGTRAVSGRLLFQHPMSFILGLLGVSLLRAQAGDYDRQFALARLAEVRSLTAAENRFGEGLELPELSIEEAYDLWAEEWSEATSSTIALERPVLDPIISEVRPGRALDVACGAGRHSEMLSRLGHSVIACDLSIEMARLAVRAAPKARVFQGDYTQLPIPDDSVDLIVCALALCHAAELGPAFDEFSRVLRPGGNLIFSDVRGPYLGARSFPVLGRTQGGSYGFIQSYSHRASDYVSSAISADFEIVLLSELDNPEFTPVPKALNEFSDPDRMVRPIDLIGFVPEAARAVHEANPSLIIGKFRKR